MKVFNLKPTVYFFQVSILLIYLIQAINCKLLEYTFNVHYISGSPDGVYKTKILSINGLFPGPQIEGVIGDTLRVTLINNIQDGQNTSIHWHGIHHKGTPFEDGASQITQCPLKNGESQVYEFPLEQSGTYWYHAHVNSQYTEGLWGVLIIKNSPEIYQYDDEIVITLNDWYHRTAHENEHWHLSLYSRGVPPYPDSGMLNGRGRFNCTVAALRNFNCTAEEQRRHIFKVTPGKTYRIRVINVSAFAAFRFSIDNHKLYAIEVDGVDTAHAVPADVAVLAAAQRYSFLVTMNGDQDSYLIRGDMMQEVIIVIMHENINPYPELLQPNTTAVLKYDRGGSKSEYDDSTTEPHDYTAEIPRNNITNPIYLDENKLSPHDGIYSPAYFDEEIILSAHFGEDSEGIRRGSFNATPFKLPSGKPLLMSLLLNETIPDTTVPFYFRYGDVVQVVINNPFYGPHPFHLHGFSFWVLGTGKLDDGDYNPGKHDLILNGARRDTVLVEEMSWAVIRFVADNPGLWVFHCHIDWHNLSGMAATFIVSPELARQNITITEESRRVCAHHGVII